MYLVDTHCHLYSEEFELDQEAVKKLDEDQIDNYFVTQ